MKLDKVNLVLYKYKVTNCELNIGEAKTEEKVKTGSASATSKSSSSAKKDDSKDKDKNANPVTPTDGKKDEKLPIKHLVTSDLINGFEIVHDFENYYMPFFVITLTVPNNIYRKMTSLEYMNHININLTIQRGQFSQGSMIPDNETDDVSKIQAGEGWAPVISGAFHAVITGGEQDLTSKIQEEAEDSDESYGQLTSISMALYNKEYYDNYNIVVNTVIRNAKLINVVTYCLNKANIKNVLLSPPTSKKKYGQFVLTPIQCYKQLDRICNGYNFHKKGTMIYFGLNRAYIISKEPACTAWEEGEYKNTHIIVASEAIGTQQTGGAYSNSQEKYHLINATSIVDSNNKGIQERVIGKNTMTIDQATGKVAKTNKKAKTVTGVVMTVEGENNLNALKQTINEAGSQVAFTCSAEDIEMLTPNKQFILSGETVNEISMSGRYRLTYVAHLFDKEGELFVLTSTVQMKGDGNFEEVLEEEEDEKKKKKKKTTKKKKKKKKKAKKKAKNKEDDDDDDDDDLDYDDDDEDDEDEDEDDEDEDDDEEEEEDDED